MPDVRYESLSATVCDRDAAIMVINEVGLVGIPKEEQLIEAIAGILARERALSGIRIHKWCHAMIDGSQSEELSAELFAVAMGWKTA